MRLKAISFYAVLVLIATCVAFGNTRGAYAFGAVALLIWFFG